MPAESIFEINGQPTEPDLSPLPDPIESTPEPEAKAEVEPDFLMQAVTVKLRIPVTVDGVLYEKLTFDFSSRISRDDDRRIKKTWKALHQRNWGAPDIDSEDLLELYLIKAGNIPLGVLRALGIVDAKGVYGLAQRWLGESMVMKLYPGS